jgi:tRNA(fMet)-specific endonuclease VapC
LGSLRLTMAYLLDSNICIAIINKNAPPRFTAALNQALRSDEELFVPTIAVHELWYGAAKSQRRKANSNNLIEFLSDPFKILNFDANDARRAGEIRAELARRGTPIGPYGVLIAGQALARGITLVTANTREFARIDGLNLANWSE